ncbi:beta-glucosidase-domain-containing protein [Biscogniauxia mediterranea]|nr:beta-glucosidase-domain-containing protein [Biscogniauxia mediterranea]
MKTVGVQAALGSAVLLLASHPYTAAAEHHHQHQYLHQRHHAHVEARDVFRGHTPSNETSNPRSQKLQARGGSTCKFPSDKGAVAITPGSMNAGWSMSPDQECADGTWCPFACPPGKMLAQWKPNTHYTYPDSMCGGIFCNNGEIEVPFSDKPWCTEGTGKVDAVNKAGDVVSFCMTQTPGNEDVIVPADVHDTLTLSVPGDDYWDKIAAHYYINPPGVDSDTGCHWGDETKPQGNWAPYVAGANTVGDTTYVKLGLNPIWQGSSLFQDKPTFGLKIECPDGGCNGLPCSCDGNGVNSDDTSTGAGGSDFCVVTATGGSKANIVIYNLDGSGGSGGDSSSSSSAAAPSSSSTAYPTSSSTSSEVASTSTSSTPEATSTTSSTSSSASATTSSSAVASSSSSSDSSDSYPTSSDSDSQSPHGYIVASVPTGGVFQQNGTASYSSTQPSPTATSATTPASTTEESSSESNTNDGAVSRQGGSAVAGLIVALVAAGLMF